MKKLSELLKLRNNHKGLFGIEVECEGANLPAIVPKQWGIHDDGSLRGRYPTERAEYVLHEPLLLDEAIKAVSDLRTHLDGVKAKLDFSFRTSVHVHVNVSDLTIDQYANMIYTYLLLENGLVRYCGNDRIGNRFCLRLQDAEGFIESLGLLFRNGVGALRNFNMDYLKYASVNVAATPRYGSLEFRAMQGNLEVEYISNWIKALNGLKEFAKRFNNPREIHDFFVRNDPSKFMQEVLGDVYRFFSYENEVDDMRLAFSLAIELPYVFEDEGVRIKRKEDELEEEKKQMLQQVERHMQRRRVEEFGDDDGPRLVMLERPNPGLFNAPVGAEFRGAYAEARALP